jgi:hypothetical protein
MAASSVVVFVAGLSMKLKVMLHGKRRALGPNLSQYVANRRNKKSPCSSLNRVHMYERQLRTVLMT